jgi:hypothetical protein
MVTQTSGLTVFSFRLHRTYFMRTIPAYTMQKPAPSEWSRGCLLLQTRSCTFHLLSISTIPSTKQVNYLLTDLYL